MGVRGLSDKFMNDLLEGELKDFLKFARNNDDIALEIRKNYINLYYKGGNLLRIKPSHNVYSCFFDKKYCKIKNKELSNDYENKINEMYKYDYKKFAENFSLLMEVMDAWFNDHPKNERDYQHKLLISNPEIIDIEYQVGNSHRFDMLAYKDGVLYIVENKYGNKAISTTEDSKGKLKSGLLKHYRDMIKDENDNKIRREMIESVVKISSQKAKLFSDTDKGIIPITKEDIKRIEYLFILTEYNKDEKQLKDEVARFGNEYQKHAYIIFASEKSTKIDFDSAEELMKAAQS